MYCLTPLGSSLGGFDGIVHFKKEQSGRWVVSEYPIFLFPQFFELPRPMQHVGYTARPVTLDMIIPISH